MDQINLAADIITDVLSGWLASRLGDRPAFEKLRRFVDTDFRKDIKNLSIYLWPARSGLLSSEENKQEMNRGASKKQFTVSFRMGQSGFPGPPKWVE